MFLRGHRGQRRIATGVRQDDCQYHGGQRRVRPDHHIMRVALFLDLDIAKLDQSCFHFSLFRWLDLLRQ